MTNYDDMSLEELEKLQEERKKAAIIKQFKADEEAKVKLELEEHDKQVKDLAVQEYIDSQNVSQPDPIVITPDQTPNKPTNSYSDSTWTISDPKEELKDIEKMYKEAGLKMDVEYGGEYESHNTDFGAKPFSYAAGTDNGCDETSQLENNWRISVTLYGMPKNVIWD